MPQILLKTFKKGCRPKAKGAGFKAQGKRCAAIVKKGCRPKAQGERQTLRGIRLEERFALGKAERCAVFLVLPNS